MGVLGDIEKKVNDFIVSRESFKTSCAEAFKKADKNKNGKIDLKEAQTAFSEFLSGLEKGLDDYGIKVDRSVNVEEYLLKYDVNNDKVLDQKEFQDFYKKMLVVSAAKATQGFGKKYGMSIVLGTMVIAGVNAAIRANVEDYSSIIKWMPALLVGPLAGMTTVFLVDQVVGEDVAGQNKAYMEDNNKKTAASDPAAPTKTLVEAEKKEKEKKEKKGGFLWFGKKDKKDDKKDTKEEKKDEKKEEAKKEEKK